MLMETNCFNSFSVPNSIYNILDLFRKTFPFATRENNNNQFFFLHVINNLHKFSLTASNKTTSTGR